MTPSNNLQGIKDFIFSISLSHLCMLRFWDEFQDHTFGYYNKTAPASTTYIPAILTTLIIAAILWGAIQMVRRSGNPRVRSLADLAFIAFFFVLPLNIVRKRILHLGVEEFTAGMSRLAVLGTAAVVALAGAYVMFRYHRKIAVMLQAVVWILTPLLPLTIMQTARAVSRYDAARFQDKAPLPVMKNTAGRVVWIVFDELDAGFIFNRPTALAMPAWDRLLSESVVSEQAYSPGKATISAIPALLTGRRVLDDAKPDGPDELRIQIEGKEQSVDWRQVPNVFTEVQQAGWNSGISGWYHPYCRLFGQLCAACSWMPASGVLHREEMVSDLSVWQQMNVQFRRVMMEIPLLGSMRAIAPAVGLVDPNVRRQERIRTREEYRTIHDNALKLVADPALNLVYLHYPVPHLLAIYNRKTNDFGVEDGQGYYDNVALVDRTLGEIRKTMADAGLWDSSTIIVSSDHPVRVAHFRITPQFWDAEVAHAAAREPVGRVPFLVKAPGQTTALVYKPRVNTVVTKDLSLDAIAGKVRSAADVSQWLDRKAPMMKN